MYMLLFSIRKIANKSLRDRFLCNHLRRNQHKSLNVRDNSMQNIYIYIHLCNVCEFQIFAASC